MNALYPQVATQARNRCEYCRAPEEVFNFPFEVEHIHPRVRNGTDDLANLALSCHACNRYKSDAVTGIDPETEQISILFHPRQHTWNTHFQAENDAGTIQGMTVIGRGTVARLRMNRPQQIRARLHWTRLGVYP